MSPEEDHLWYDHEEADEPFGPFALVMSCAVIAFERLVFFPGELWLSFKLGTIAAFQDVTDIQR